jgi:hypothetical protein
LKWIYSKQNRDSFKFKFKFYKYEIDIRILKNTLEKSYDDDNAVEYDDGDSDNNNDDYDDNRDGDNFNLLIIASLVNFDNV